MPKGKSKPMPTKMGNNPFSKMPQAAKEMKAQGKSKGKKGY